jgi:LPXTG-site transpeptidase (sortase) family protein
VLTSPDPTKKRGGPPWRSAALGVVAVVGALLAPWLVVAMTSPADETATAVRRPGSEGTAPAATQTPNPLVVPETRPYDVAPDVEIDSAEPTPRPAPAPGVPRRLVVPMLGVDAAVVPITAPGGVLLPPSDPQMLGWWRDGAKPGAARGGALITGHTVSSGGGAFDNLESLRRGDEVRVRTPDRVLRYEVAGVRIYRKARIARDAEQLFSQTVPGRLVLITCEDWNGSFYESNAVIFAERV